jgi:hypothetical protein
VEGTTGRPRGPAVSHLSASVRRSLEAEGLTFVFHEADEGGCFALVMEGDHTAFDTWVGCYEDTHRLLVVSSYPLFVPPHLAAAATEYLLRVNIDLIIGAFDFDHDTGAVRFRTAVDVEGIADPATFDTLFRNIFYTNIIATDRYFAGLAKVLYSGIGPADAVALIRDAH